MRFFSYNPDIDLFIECFLHREQKFCAKINLGGNPWKMAGNMLQTIESVNWKNLYHAYGEATNIPEFFNLLANETDFQNWRTVLADLAKHVFHQETLYPATAYTIPFINQLLTHASAAKTYELLSLLAQFLQNSLKDDHRIGSDGLPTVHYQRAVRETITREVDFYNQFQKHPEPSVRAIAATLCAMIA